MTQTLKFKMKSIEGQEVKVVERIFHAKFKALPEEGDGTFEAYVSVFGNADSYGEIVDRGAFKDFLAAYPPDPTTGIPRYPKGVWAHDWSKPISATLEVREDDFGLYIKGRLVLEVQQAAECYALMKAGVITDFSFGYGVDEDYMDSNDGLRHLRKLSIFEYSPVLVGANRRAELIGVKADGQESGDQGGEGGDGAAAPAAGDPPATGEGDGAAPAAAPGEEEKPTAEDAAKAMKEAVEAIKACTIALEAVKTAIESSGSPAPDGSGSGDNAPGAAGSEGGNPGDGKVDLGTDNGKQFAKLILKEARSIDKSVEKLIIKAKKITN